MAKITRKLFGSNLKRIIEKLGLTYEKAAEKCELSPSFMKKLIYGTTGFSPETLDEICKGLKCAPGELFVDEIPKGLPRDQTFSFAAEVLAQLEKIEPLKRAVVLGFLFGDPSFGRELHMDQKIAQIVQKLKEIL